VLALVLALVRASERELASGSAWELAVGLALEPALVLVQEWLWVDNRGRHGIACNFGQGSRQSTLLSQGQFESSTQ